MMPLIFEATRTRAAQTTICDILVDHGNAPFQTLKFIARVAQ
ncbi:jg19808, partial [Pararge aegeria aegeria]